MELPVNRDPENLSVSAFSGRKPWQYACIAGAAGICVAFVLLFQEALGQTLCSVICIVLAVPPGYLGVFSKNGMDFFEYRKAKKALGAGTYLYGSPPHLRTPEDGLQKKKGFVYIVKNIATGGKYL